MKKENLVLIGLVLFAIAFFIGQAVQSIGRYQIFMHPVVRADQYLLDTKTGRTWQITQESREKYMFWHEIPRDQLTLPDNK